MKISGGVVSAGLLLAGIAPAQRIEPSLFERLEYRSIGPASMGGRIADIEGVAGNPNVVYAASASGGLFKTTNGGMTWSAIFDKQKVISIGDIAVDPSNPEVIWVGTGEANARNTVSLGDGIYKSVDGGKTWKNLGLRDTRHIARIVIHPQNGALVYVAALGHNTGPNEERGVFMTTDGGETWKKVLYLDSEHGAPDLDIDPVNPNILYAALWKFDRKPWKFISGSEQGGVFRSVDGGRTWTKLSNGLPKLLGRIGVKVAPSNPSVVYVIAESKEHTLYRSDNHGDTFHGVTRDPNIIGRGLYYSDMRVDPMDENRLYALGMRLSMSIDGGRTWRRISNRTHGDYQAMWIDPKNPSRIWQGQDGGLAVSYDRGENWEAVLNLPMGQFYQVWADNRYPFYHLSGGLQDNGSWTGPSRTVTAGIGNDQWRVVSGGDGFHVVSHPDQPDLYLSESQGGGLVRTDLRISQQEDASPQPRRNDGGPAGELKYRFNWNTPIVLSPHDKNTVYFGGNVIFKSTDFGKTWQAISPDLTTNDPAKTGNAGETVWVENTTAEYHCTVIRIAESPLKAGMIWAGTDDGNLQLTTNGGKTWTNLAKNAGLPPFSPIAYIEPSRTGASIAYAAFERHHFDDLRPYVFKTTDSGKTWTNITGDLPENAYVWVVKEDPKNPKLLYAGTELGLYVSFEGGNHWVPLHLKNLPPVAVRDLLVHPRENDLVLGTHGRSIWILDDITPWQQLNPEILSSEAHLFDMRPALRFNAQGRRAGFGSGNKPFVGPNPPYGALVTYYLKDKPDDKAPLKLQVLDHAGRLVREIKELPKDKGLNRVAWDLRTEPPKLRRPPGEQEREMEEFFGRPAGPQVLPGRYTVRLMAGSKTYEKPLEVRLDPTVAVSPADLENQYDTNRKLRDMISSTNEALRSLDAMKEQMQQVDGAVKALLAAPPKDLTEALAERQKEVEALIGRMARPQNIPGYSMGPRLSDRLSALFRSIDQALAAPTPAQQEFFGELQAEYQKELSGVNALLTQKIPQLNELLRNNNAATVMTGKAIQMPEWMRPQLAGRRPPGSE